VTRWCFVVLLGEFATDIPRALWLKIKHLQTAKFRKLLFQTASNQVVGDSNPSGREIFTKISGNDCQLTLIVGDNSNRRHKKDGSTTRHFGRVGRLSQAKAIPSVSEG
jgi:hypothetical protein